MSKPLPSVFIDPDVAKEYTIGPVLGKGSYGTVFGGTSRRTGAPVAVKVMNRERLGAKGESNVRNEIAVMSLLVHPTILHMHKAIYSKQHINIVLDKVAGGELLKQIIKLQHYSERTAAVVMRNLLLGIQFMQAEGVVHRDLKPDNMLLVDIPTAGNAQVTDIKIADFGFATKYRGEILTQPCGTPYYIAPEILDVGVYKTRACYGHHVDVWSAGVIAFILLSGRPPFDGKDKKRLFDAIHRGQPDFSHPVFKTLSPEAHDFLRRILQTDPLKRMTPEEALKHKWLSWLNRDAPAKADPVPDVHLSTSLEGIAEFDAREKIKGAVYGVEAAFRLMYLTNCKQNKIKPNTALLEQMTATTKRIHSIDLSNNYVGPRGVQQLVSIVATHTEVHTISLRNSLIDDAQLEPLLHALASPMSKVTTLHLDDNPITHSGGRGILALLYRNENIREVTLDRTHISETIKKKIRMLLDRLPALPQYQRQRPRSGKPAPPRPPGQAVPTLPSIKPQTAPVTGAHRMHPSEVGGAHQRGTSTASTASGPAPRRDGSVPKKNFGQAATKSRLPMAAATFFGKKPKQ